MAVSGVGGGVGEVRLTERDSAVVLVELGSSCSEWDIDGPARVPAAPVAMLGTTASAGPRQRKGVNGGHLGGGDVGSGRGGELGGGGVGSYGVL